MLLRCEPRNPTTVNGPASLEVRDVAGVFAKNYAGRNQLFLDLVIYLDILGGGPGSSPKPRIELIRNVRFSLCLDRDYSVIGKAGWAELQKRSASLEELDYEWVLRHAKTLEGRKEGKSGIFMYFYKMALHSSSFSLQNRNLPLKVGMGHFLKDEGCCLGRDFLSRGLLCWRRDVTYFFPYALP